MRAVTRGYELRNLEQKIGQLCTLSRSKVFYHGFDLAHCIFMEAGGHCLAFSGKPHEDCPSVICIRIALNQAPRHQRVNELADSGWPHTQPCCKVAYAGPRFSWQVREAVHKLKLAGARNFGETRAMPERCNRTESLEKTLGNLPVFSHIRYLELLIVSSPNNNDAEMDKSRGQSSVWGQSLGPGSELRCWRA